MKRDYNLMITNCFTNDIDYLHDFSDCVYLNDNNMSAMLLYTKVKRYIDNQIPFKVEFNYKSLGKSI